MNIKLNALCVGGFLALTSFLVQPVRADEWNKRTEFQFSAPVEIPGKVLAPGKYVFEVADSESDRNIVQVFSENSDGNEALVATLMAIPDYMQDTPDKPIIHFEERNSGSPEAIHSWFYPGDNTGWEFIYPKTESRAMSSNTPPAAAPAPAAAPVPDRTPAPELAAAPEPTGSVTVTEDDVAFIAQNDAPALPPAPSGDNQDFADRTLPQTAGYSGLEFVTSLAMLSGGIAALFASRRKFLA